MFVIGFMAFKLVRRFDAWTLYWRCWRSHNFNRRTRAAQVNHSALLAAAIVRRRAAIVRLRTSCAILRLRLCERLSNIHIACIFSHARTVRLQTVRNWTLRPLRNSLRTLRLNLFLTQSTQGTQRGFCIIRGSLKSFRLYLCSGLVGG